MEPLPTNIESSSIESSLMIAEKIESIDDAIQKTTPDRPFILIEAGKKIIKAPKRLIDYSPVITAWYESDRESNEPMALDATAQEIEALINYVCCDKCDRATYGHAKRIANYLMIWLDHVAICRQIVTRTNYDGQMRQSAVFTVTYRGVDGGMSRIEISHLLGENGCIVVPKTGMFYAIDRVKFTVNEKPIVVPTAVLGEAMVEISVIKNIEFHQFIKFCGMNTTYVAPPMADYTRDIKGPIVSIYAGYVSLDDCTNENSWTGYHVAQLCISLLARYSQHFVGVNDRFIKALNRYND